MNKSSGQWREWFIFEKNHFEQIAFNDPGPGRWHVIEMDAFNAVYRLAIEREEEIERLKKRNSRLTDFYHKIRGTDKDAQHSLEKKAFDLESELTREREICDVMIDALKDISYKLSDNQYNDAEKIAYDALDKVRCMRERDI